MPASGKSTISKVPTKRVMTMTRDFDAPRDLVWEVYTQPEHIVHWMSASDWTSPSAEVEARTGGRFKVEMRPLNGTDGFFFEGVYDEVVAPELLVLEIGDGRIMRTTFEDLGDKKTRLTLSWEMARDEALERQGYTQILDKLTDYVKHRRPTKPEVIITRVFDAPRDLVFAAFTEPKHLGQWFSPNGFTTPTVESDPKPGGVFRVGMRAGKALGDLEGQVFWASGTYREVTPPERLALTMSGEGTEGNIDNTMVTITFLERAGKTRVIVHQTGMTIVQRDGASQGWSESLDKLAAYLAASPR
jgi:uncharacterized protein YndB with AHSA1/START domain